MREGVGEVREGLTVEVGSLLGAITRAPRDNCQQWADSSLGQLEQSRRPGISYQEGQRED